MLLADDKHRDSYKEIDKLNTQIYNEEVAITALGEEITSSKLKIQKLRKKCRSVICRKQGAF